MREQNHYHKIDAIMQSFDNKLRNSYNSIGTQELLRKANHQLSSNVLNQIKISNDELRGSKDGSKFFYATASDDLKKDKKNN
jgi:anaerobic ribonucleoside-triphosphate reductase